MLVNRGEVRSLPTLQWSWGQSWPPERAFMGDTSKESHRIFFFSPWTVKKTTHSYQHQLNPEKDFSFLTHPYPFYALCLKKYNLGNLDGFLCTTLLQVSNSRQYWSQCFKQPCNDTNSMSSARQVKERRCFPPACSTEPCLQKLMLFLAFALHFRAFVLRAALREQGLHSNSIICPLHLGEASNFLPFPLEILVSMSVTF